MCSIHFIRTENPAWCYHPYWKLSLFHFMYLYRRSLCTQKNILCNIECILLIFCRVVCRYIKCFKIIIIFFNFWSFNYFIAHSNKYILDLFQGYSIRVAVPFCKPCSRKCNIYFFPFKLFFKKCLFKFFFLSFKLLINLSSCFIYHLSCLWPVFWCNIFHRFKQ